VAALILGAGITTWVWLFHKGAGKQGPVVESSTNPYVAVQHYEKPELKVEAPVVKPTPRDRTDEILAMLRKMQEEIDALKNHKHPAPAVVQ